jgi:hypothetical protein
VSQSSLVTRPPLPIVQAPLGGGAPAPPLTVEEPGAQARAALRAARVRLERSAPA